MNLPLHCFGYHANCSPDFCKTAQQRNMGNATPATHEQHKSSSVAAPADESNLTSALKLIMTLTIQVCNCYNIVWQQFPLLFLDLDDIIAAQEQAWIDATADDGLEEVRDIPATPQNKLDQAMICNIQRVASRLVAKAPQLIGMLDTLNNT